MICPQVNINQWHEVLLFSLGHVSPYWYSHFPMNLLVDIHTLSCIQMLLVSIGICTLIDTELCIPVLIFILVHEYTCWHSHVVIYWNVFTLGHVSLCCNSNLLMYPHFDIHPWSCTVVVIFTVVHVSQSYSHFVMCPYVDIYSCSWVPLFDIFTWSCIPMLIFILNIPKCSCIPVLLFTLGHV